MNTQTIWKKLGRFKSVSDVNGAMVFYSRTRSNPDRFVSVIFKEKSCVAFPMILENDGTQRAAFHAKTIKSLVEFLEGK